MGRGREYSQRSASIPALGGQRRALSQETSLYLLRIRSLLVLFLHHKELASDLEVLFRNPLIHTRCLKSTTAHTPVTIA